MDVKLAGKFFDDVVELLQLQLSDLRLQLLQLLRTVGRLVRPALIGLHGFHDRFIPLADEICHLHGAVYNLVPKIGANA